MEDIYNILQISRARRKIPGVNIPPPKAKIMAAYYEKLTNLFWYVNSKIIHRSVVSIELCYKVNPSFLWFEGFRRTTFFMPSLGTNITLFVRSTIEACR